MWLTLLRQIAVFAAASFGGAWLGSEPTTVDTSTTLGWWKSQPVIVRVFGWVALAAGVLLLFNVIKKKFNK